MIYLLMKLSFLTLSFLQQLLKDVQIVSVAVSDVIITKTVYALDFQMLSIKQKRFQGHAELCIQWKLLHLFSLSKKFLFAQTEN